MATVPRIAASATERYCVADRLSEILEGGLGFFWPVVSGSFPDLETDEPRSGYIRRDDDAVSVVLQSKMLPRPSKHLRRSVWSGIHNMAEC